MVENWLNILEFEQQLLYVYFAQAVEHITKIPGFGERIRNIFFHPFDPVKEIEKYKDELERLRESLKKNQQDA